MTMTKMSNKIVFFGSGPVAAKSLELLIQNFEVDTVVTKPSTVKQMTSIAKDICVYSVNTHSELDDLITAQGFEMQIGVLIDFGIIVSQKVIDSFELGIINSHFSLLPEWRGADPITFSILSGQKTTGVSLMKLVEAMDEGPLLGYGEYELNPNITGPRLTQDLIQLSDALLKKLLPAYCADELSLADQSVTGRTISYSRKLNKDDGILDFSKPAEILAREIRAFIEWPKSRTEIAGKDVVVLKASVDASAKGNPGDIFKTTDKKIGIYCSEGSLIIEELKPAGKQAMTSEGFLAGYGSKF